MRRKIVLATEEVYHIFNRSIADFKIFNNDEEFIRMKYALAYFQLRTLPSKFSQFLEQDIVEREGFESHFYSTSQGIDKIVQIIAYCIMPTHIHLILKQIVENGISIFMGNLLNSYSRYFNTKHKRKGPLWEGKFKNVLVKSDEQLLHLSRYIHLNPVTAFLVDAPVRWPFSSYQEYLSQTDNSKRICNYQGIIRIEMPTYKKFVEDRIAYQRELAILKGLILE